MTRYFRENINQMAGYTPGLQPQSAGWIKLNTNENPYPPSPKVLEAIRAELANLRKYPDPMAESFRRAAGPVLGCRPEQILAGNGSDDILTIVFRSFLGPNDTVACLYPTYSLYPVLARIQGCACVSVDWPEDYTLPPKLFHTGAKVAIVANPNAPTGTTIPIADIAALASVFDGVVVVDEAYADFADENALGLVERHTNLIVTRSFSKSYSLAGLRFGFAAADEDLIQGMVKVKDSYNVDRLAAAGATAAILDQEHMKANVARIRKTRAVLTTRLTQLGFSVAPSQANFVLARCAGRDHARRIYDELQQRRILVRYFDAPRVDDCLRISVGTDQETNDLLLALEGILRIQRNA